MFPIFFENSRVPKWIGKVAPIEPYAVSFGLWVWCVGKMDARIRRHEVIHYRQQLEMLFVFQWVLYVLFWLILRVRLGDGRSAYRYNPFELEAYKNDTKEDYLSRRPFYAWAGYIRQGFKGGGREF